jgi:hypothetical protein
MKNDNTGELKKEFPGTIRSIVHDGQEIVIRTKQNANPIEIQHLMKRLETLGIKMYCIKDHLSEKTLADERGIK